MTLPKTGHELEKGKIKLTGPQETLMMTLLARAVDARSPIPILNDTLSLEITKRVQDEHGYDLHTRTESSHDSLLPKIVSARGRAFDEGVEEFLTRNPGSATVLHLACGLDTRSHRVRWQGKGRVWIDVDKPEVVELRRRILEDPVQGLGEYRLLSADIIHDNDWLGDLRVPTDRPILVVFEGLIMYLTPDEVVHLFQVIQRHVADTGSGGEIHFDSAGYYGYILSNYGTAEPWKRMGAGFNFYMTWHYWLVARVPGLELTKSLSQLTEYARFAGRPLDIENVEITTAREAELIIKVGAIAVNPVDWLIQDRGEAIFPWLEYPFVPGTDVAGTIVEIGPGVDRGTFNLGDRVLGCAVGFANREGAFQNYVAVNHNLATRIPDTLPLVNAAVLPLGFATAAGALFEPSALGLVYSDLRPAAAAHPSHETKTVIIWAGASSVGANAVQLATRAGYEVFTTSLPGNFAFCKSLGATRVFDYHSPSIVAEMANALEGRTIAGAVAIHLGSLEIIYKLLARDEVKGSKRVASTVPLGTSTPPEGVVASMVIGGTIKDNDIGAALFRAFLTAALAEGSYRAKPDALVLGEGLEALQAALDYYRVKKVSAQKIVVSLP
ncbi:hypothetical protein PspLS_06414 [Pyricularia sp. CBS 133598]|nr:hypothetical protein PspLS_06414 [Pyricularia sp. CBS 133598]